MKKKSHRSEDDFADATWDLRFDAFSFSSTLFVDAEGETQLVFSFTAKPSKAESSLVKSLISAGGGVFLDDAHDAEERLERIDEDWASRRDVHLIPIDEIGFPADVCSRCQAPIVSVHFLFECARSNKLFALIDFRVPASMKFHLSDPPMSELWRRFRHEDFLYRMRRDKRAVKEKGKAKQPPVGISDD